MPHEYVPWSAGPRLRRPRRRARGRSTQSHALADRADRARGQPAHRGQPAELPPRDRAGLRPRQRLGHLGEPVDRRGGPARVLHPRLPARHPRRRPRRARAGPDGDDGDGLRRRRQAAAQRLRLRVVPGARHPRLAPQHRPLHRGADRREAAHPRRQGREPAHDLLPQHRRRRRSSSTPEPDDAGDHRRGRRLPDAGQRSSPASPARPCRWPRPASTTCASTTTTSSTPLLRQWGVFELEGLDAEGEQAREELAAAVAALDARGDPVRRAARGGRAAKKAARRSGGAA